MLRPVKTWLKALSFPLAALLLGLGTKTAFPDGFAGAGEPQEETEFSRVTWQEAGPRVESGEWLLVDAREEEHFHAQHIPGAISLPSHSYPEMLEFFAEEQGKTKTVVVYCGTEDCDVSTDLAVRLRDEAGYRDVRILEGGFLAWQRQH